MGNRATVAFTQQGAQTAIGVHLHWNGGPESVYPMLRALDALGARNDCDYKAARFTQMVGNFLGGQLSLGLQVIDLSRPLDATHTGAEDHGVYLVHVDTGEVTRFDPDGNPLDATHKALEIARAQQHPYTTEGDAHGRSIYRAIIEANREPFIERADLGAVIDDPAAEPDPATGEGQQTGQRHPAAGTLFD